MLWRMINPVSGNGNQVSDAQRQQFAETRQATLSAAASLFNESPDQLQSQLGSGLSLSDIASQKGVSQDDLLKTIQAAVKQVNPNASDTQVSNIAQRAISGHHHHGGGHHHQAPPVDQTTSAPLLPDDSTISIKA